MTYPGTLPADQRRSMPQIWITPDGVQVGRGGADDRIGSSTGDSVSSTTDITITGDYSQRNPPPTVICVDEPDPPSDCCDCEEIRQIVIEELDNKFPPARPNTLVFDDYLAAGSRTLVLPPYSESVRLTIVQPPANVKGQFGGGGAPNVSFNGWYSFGRSGHPGERIPLNYDVISANVPVGCTHFSYTIVGGGTAEARVQYRVAT